jgi:hypothetical protein
MDPVTLLMIAGAVMSIWSAVAQRASARTPEEKATADQKVNEAWAAAEALLAPHVVGARSRLEALARGENPYATPTLPPPPPSSDSPS